MTRVKMLGTVLAAALASTAAFSVPRPAHAVLCCETGYQTAKYWVKASSCAAANAAYRALAFPDAVATCGSSTAVCAFKNPPCYFDSAAQMWVVDGKATHGCMESCDL